MTTFTTSFGRTIKAVPGYREAHSAWTSEQLFTSPPFGIDGFVRDVYQYSIMRDFLSSYGISSWGRALDIGGAEGTLARLLRGEGRARWAGTVEIQDFSKRLSTAAFLRYWAKFQLATSAARCNPALKRFLLGEGAWKGRRLSPTFPEFGYYPPPNSIFWNLWLRHLPKADAYWVQDVYELQEAFDFITMLIALPHFDPQHLFRKVSELLVEGGVFFFLSDNWWFSVNSTRLVGLFPYVLQRLTKQDLERYVVEAHPDESQDWMRRYNYFHGGKLQPTLSDYISLAASAGLELIGARMLFPPHETHVRAAISPRRLNRNKETQLADVLNDVHQFRPDVQVTDLMASHVMAVFRKPRVNL